MIGRGRRSGHCSLSLVRTHSPGSARVSFSLSDLDSDNMEMDYGKTSSTSRPWQHLEWFGPCLMPPLLPHRGRGPARPPLRPLFVLVPPVGGAGGLRPGAGQQHLQEAVSGEASLHSRCCSLLPREALEAAAESQVCLLSLRRPFRPSLSSFTRMSSSLKPVQDLTVFGDNLLRDIALVGGNDSGIFVSSVRSGSQAEKAGLREGHHLLLVGFMRAPGWLDPSMRSRHGRLVKGRFLPLAKLAI